MSTIKALQGRNAELKRAQPIGHGTYVDALARVQKANGILMFDDEETDEEYGGYKRYM